MNEEQEAENDCQIEATDVKGDPNLCCCYVLDEEGHYLDPCYRPVDTCC